MQQRLGVFILILVLLLALSACACEHQWTEVSCETPQVCTKCQTVGAPAAGHGWLDATCTEAATCSRCGAVQGEPLGHSFTDYRSNGDATCNADGTRTAHCDHCGLENTLPDPGSRLTHSFTDYHSNGDATCDADGTRTAQCDHCGQENTLPDPGSRLEHNYENGSCTNCGSLQSCVASLTGDLYSFGTKTAVTLALYRTGENTPFDRLTTKEDRYCFSGVGIVSCTLTASKENHVTRAYDLYLQDGENYLSVQLHLLGDINGDGRVNVGDSAIAYAHSKKTALIRDLYRLACSDVNSDGITNVGDVARIYAHAKKTTPLW